MHIFTFEMLLDIYLFWVFFHMMAHVVNQQIV